MKNLLALLRRFSIRTRMRGAIAMVLMMFALVGGVGVFGGHRIKVLNSEFMAHSIQEVEAVSDIRSHLAQVRVHEKNMVIDYEDGVAVLKHRESWMARIAATRKAFDILLQGEEDADNPIARDSLARLDAYVKASASILDNIQNGAYDNARTADRMLAKAQQEIAAVEGNVESIAAIVRAEGAHTQQGFNDTMMLVLLAFGATVATAVLVVVPLTLLNSHSITGPVSYAARVADAIAGGDLTRPIRVEGRDETAQLLAALARMQDSLQQVVGQVHAASQSIRSSSAEVAAGNGNLSQRTEEASSSLQQTASSMEHLTGNVHDSAESARQASELAVTAARVAQRGGVAVAQVVSTMEEITVSSRKIADIIGTIDGIAFQTNILSLNAAVEAARAGEQGRGFAVVASEVPALAQRSAGAAREIRGLIGASVERVQAGSRLVAEAGSTMDEIVASVQRVSDIIARISLAAGEQSVGIGQVNDAVAGLDRMTQQNAALVEQSAAAAQSLKEEAERLGAVVGTFRIDRAAPAA